MTQAELDAGTPIVNMATVTGTGATPDTDDASVAVAQSKILHIEKDATVADGTANSTSDTITYTLTVTNRAMRRSPMWWSRTIRHDATGSR